MVLSLLFVEILGSGSLLVTKGFPSENALCTQYKEHDLLCSKWENNAFSAHCHPFLARKVHRSPRVSQNQILFIIRSITFRGIRMQHRQKQHTLPGNLALDHSWCIEVACLLSMSTEASISFQKKLIQYDFVPKKGFLILIPSSKRAVCTKSGQEPSYLAEPVRSQMAPIRFAGLSRGFQRKDMVPKK